MANIGARFNGSNQAAISPSGLASGNVDLTLMCWVNLPTTPAGNRQIVGRGRLNFTTQGVQIQTTANRDLIFYAEGNGTRIVAAAHLQLGTWYLLCQRFDKTAGLHRGFANGTHFTPVALAAWPTNWETETNWVHVAERGFTSGEELHANYAGCGLWNGTHLSDAAVEAVHAAGPGQMLVALESGDLAAATAIWPMNDAGDQGDDATGNGWDLTISNGPLEILAPSPMTYYQRLGGA